MRSGTPLLTVAALFLIQSTASACGAHLPPTRYAVVPGGGLIIAPWIGLILPVLTGTLERPIYSAAGYRHHTLWHSIQANLLAMLAMNTVGTAGAYFVGGLVLPEVAGWTLAILFILLLGAAVKWAWFRRVIRESRGNASILVFLLATALSAAGSASMLVWMELLNTNSSAWAEKIIDVQPICIVVSLGLAVCVYVEAFRRAPRFNPDDTLLRYPGFDVLPPPHDPHDESSIPQAIPVDNESPGDTRAAWN
jgi:hypothetical protein